jgi:3-isopropylmalate/(R)-2-methylmalate dehydratase small subunit
MLAVELPAVDIDRILAMSEEGEVQIDVDLQGHQVTASVGSRAEVFTFEISPFDQALVEAGGWVEFADQRY